MPGELATLRFQGVAELAASPALSPVRRVLAALGGPGLEGLVSSFARVCSSFFLEGREGEPLWPHQGTPTTSAASAPPMD